MYRGSELHEQIQKEVFDTNTREYWSAPASSAAPALVLCLDQTVRVARCRCAQA